MTAKTLTLTPSLAPDQIVPEALPILGAVTTDKPSNPETSLAIIIGLLTRRDALICEQIAGYMEAGESADKLAQEWEVPAATIEAYSKARTALLTVELPAEVVAAFKVAQDALMQADTNTQEQYRLTDEQREILARPVSMENARHFHDAAMRAKEGR